MKRLLGWALAVALALSCALPAGAVDEAEGSPPVVYSTAELLEAIEEAEDGDTIIMASKCTIEEDTTIGEEGKRITLIPAEGFSDGVLFGCREGASASFVNLIIDGKAVNANAIYAFPASITLSDVCIKNMQDSAVWIDGKGSLTIEGCNFTDNSAVSGAHIWIGLEVVAEITDTSFIGGDGRTGSGGAIRSSSELYIFNCVFDGNNAKSGGAIYIGRGRCEIENSKITSNSATWGNGGGVYSMSELIISNIEIYNNTATQCGADIFCIGNVDISLTDDKLDAVYQLEGKTPLGFYADEVDHRFDGASNVTELQGLPISKSDVAVALIFVFEDDIVTPEPVADPAPEPEPEPDPTPEQHRDQEPAGDGEPESETTAASKANDSTGTEDSTPRGNYSGYTSPVTIRRAPEPADNPEPVATVEPEPPALICGGAVLDPSNRAYLNGYGDGVIGEDDPITRAQIAQLFYRLLTEESRAALSGAESKFDDVPASAWYHPAVSAIASAGVVIGCGDGFHPNEYLTRAQLITIMVRFIEPMEHESGFADISGHWAENYIKTAEAAGWITADGDLRPDEYVTRGETVTFINTVLDAQTRGTPPALPND